MYINGIKDENGDITGQTLAGIHSGGLGCGGLNVPAFWQRVSTFSYLTVYFIIHLIGFVQPICIGLVELVETF